MPDECEKATRAILVASLLAANEVPWPIHGDALIYAGDIPRASVLVHHHQRRHDWFLIHIPIAVRVAQLLHVCDLYYPRANEARHPAVS